MSKIESGKMQLGETEFELGDWLDSVITMVQSQTNMRGQHFIIHIWNISHELLCGDTVRLSQILTNVLGNAVKFTPKNGKIHLDVTEVPSSEETAAHFVFRISDTGIGMSQEYMSHIFEMFSREQNGNSEAVQGTGLGMAITKRIVDLMGGTIEVESEQGVGTVFTIMVPLRLGSGGLPQIAAKRMLVIGVPGSEKECEDTIYKLKEIGVDAVYRVGYSNGVRLAGEEKAAGRPFSIVFLPYQMIQSDKTLTDERLREDFGEEVKVLLGVNQDEQTAFEQMKQKCFWQTIRLPLYRMSLYRKITELSGDEEDEGSGLEGKLSGRHILLVEDNAINSEIAVEMLTGLMGAQVDTAQNGEEGCERFLSAPAGTYDVILMDLQMPILGGLDAAKKIRNSAHPQAFTIPIIALTANAFEEDRREALGAGMNGFVSKPIDFTILSREIIRVQRESGTMK